MEAYSMHVMAEKQQEDYIKWVDFNVPLSLLEKALRYDIEFHEQELNVSWIQLLAYTAAKHGGEFHGAQPSKTMDALVERLRQGEMLQHITHDMRYYTYYINAYTAVLGGFVGSHTAGDGKAEYGLIACSPIARGYGFGHYEDFGSERTYGYKRLHLGNDLMGAIGTPIIAVEGGVVEALGWNEYGGWRVGIRSHDGLRYWYYAHMQKDHPYPLSLQQGQTVKAGDVIGYMGMTGYSKKENVNNINVPHLHIGLQLIFHESQKDGENQIWVDVYNLIELLERHRIPVEIQGKDMVRADGLQQGGSRG